MLDPDDPWGLGLLDLDEARDARAIGENDPAVQSGTCVYELVPMQLVRAHEGDFDRPSSSAARSPRRTVGDGRGSVFNPATTSDVSLVPPGYRRNPQTYPRLPRRGQ